MAWDLTRAAVLDDYGRDPAAESRGHDPHRARTSGAWLCQRPGDTATGSSRAIRRARVLYFRQGRWETPLRDPAVRFDWSGAVCMPNRTRRREARLDKSSRVAPELAAS